MSRIFVILSHTLTQEQTLSAYNDLKIKDIVYMPENLKKIWSSIPPEKEKIQHTIEPILNWIKENTQENDYIIIQGDMGAVYITINYAFKLKLKPCYTTTKRVTLNEENNNGTVNIIKQFKHVRFRLYEKMG